MSSAEQPPGYPGQPPGPQPGASDIDWESPGLGTRVNEIVDAVEREATKLRQEAEHDAAQIRAQAEEEARRYVEQARQQSESLVARRMERIQELSDALMARAEEVLERLDYAVPVKAGFENLVRALGETAERLASQDYSEFGQPSWDEVRSAGAPVPGPGQPAPVPGYPPPAAGGHAPAEPHPGAAAPPYPPPAPGTATVPPPGGYPQPGEQPSGGYPPQADQPGGIQPPAQPAPAPGGAWQGLDDAHRIAIQMAAAGSTRGDVEAHLAHTPAATRASLLDEIFGAGTPAETRVPWATPPAG